MATICRFVVFIVFLFVSTSFAAKAADDKCQKLSDTQVRNLFNRWNQALSTLNPTTVVGE
jgi:hypothetical protein